MFSDGVILGEVGPCKANLQYQREQMVWSTQGAEAIYWISAQLFEPRGRYGSQKLGSSGILKLVLMLTNALCCMECDCLHHKRLTQTTQKSVE